MTEKDKIQNEVIDVIVKNNFNGFVRLPTGTGKGKIMCEILKILNPSSVLYCCDNKDLRDKTFKEELIKWGCEDFIPRIEMQCYQTAYKFVGREDVLLLADEADVATSPEYSKVFFNNHFKHKLLFSGSLADDRRAVIKKAVPIIYEMFIDEAEDKNILNKASITHVNYLLNPEENKKYLGYNNAFKKILGGKTKLSKHEQFKLKQIQLGRKHFLSGLKTSVDACRKLLKELYTKDNKIKILIFCNSKEEADSVSKYSYYSGNEHLDNLNKFDNNEIPVLSVVAKIDRGLNISGVNHIIFKSPSRSKTKLQQRSGRGRRLHIDDTVHLFFLIPYFKNLRGDITPTVIKAYVDESCSDLNTEKIKNINYVN